MKTMKKSFFRLFDKMIVLLLGGFGMFGACNVFTSGDMPEETPVEYGMPHAAFVLQGTVTGKVTAQPIQNIRVVRPFGYENQYGDTTYTDENGKYAYLFGDFPEIKYQLKFEDMDGEDNGGRFQTKEVEVQFTQADQVEKGQGWFYGKFVKTEDVALDPEEFYANPEYGILHTSFQP